MNDHESGHRLDYLHRSPLPFQSLPSLVSLFLSPVPHDPEWTYGRAKRELRAVASPQSLPNLDQTGTPPRNFAPAKMGAVCCCLADPVDFDSEVTLYHFNLYRVVGRGAFGKVAGRSIRFRY